MTYCLHAYEVLGEFSEYIPNIGRDYCEDWLCVYTFWYLFDGTCEFYWMFFLVLVQLHFGLGYVVSISRYLRRGVWPCLVSTSANFEPANFAVDCESKVHETNSLQR